MTKLTHNYWFFDKIIWTISTSFIRRGSILYNIVLIFFNLLIYQTRFMCYNNDHDVNNENLLSIWCVFFWRVALQGGTRIWKKPYSQVPNKRWEQTNFQPFERGVSNCRGALEIVLLKATKEGKYRLKSGYFE